METLDNPAWAALTGPHRSLAEGGDRARRYPVEVSIFGAVDDPADPDAWSVVTALVGAGGVLATATARPPVVPDGHELLFDMGAVQQVLRQPAPDLSVDADIRPIVAADVDAVVALVMRTDPGPFARRTVDLGGYMGAFVDDALVGLAGRRFVADDAVEISAVCTDPAFRGRGLAAGLTARVAAAIQAEGRLPFLHTTEANESARRVYTRLGFEVRGPMRFIAVQSPS